jgi:homoserine O-acetyltransferase/O-succinyltransferase
MVERLGLIATSFRQPAQAVALATLQCQQILLDPDFNGGNYSPESAPIRGLNLARQIGHLSYRCSIELDARFGRQQDHEGRFQVNNYLEHQGNKLTARFDANCYLRLNQAMIDFDACVGRGEPRFALSRLQQPALVVAIDSDWLYPPSEQVRLAALLPNSVYSCVSASSGHDGFLLEAASFEPLLAALLSEQASQPQLRLA